MLQLIIFYNVSIGEILLKRKMTMIGTTQKNKISIPHELLDVKANFCFCVHLRLQRILPWFLIYRERINVLSFKARYIK